jgi:hypothetical protein
MQISHAHPIYPGCQDKEDYKREDISHEDYSNQCITNNLSYITSVSERNSNQNKVLTSW